MINDSAAALAAAMLLLCPMVSRAGSPQIVSVKKIWGSAPHSASGDLVRYKNNFLCAFKEAGGHVSRVIGRQDNGKLRIIESADGSSWSSVALIAEDGIDLRDPHFSVMPDGRLMMIAGGTTWSKDARYVKRRTRVFFSTNGRDWTPPQTILADEDWLWRVTWHGKRAYGVAYQGGGGGPAPRGGQLYSGTDGIHYERIAEMEVPGINETTLRVLPGGDMVAMARREYENMHGWIGVSKPPYGSGTGRRRLTGLPGPTSSNCRIRAFGRAAGLHLPDPPPGPGVGQTALGTISRTSYERVLILPSNGDNAYSGMVWHDSLLWMIYYSTHEEQTSICLAKIRF
ncbi:MAG: exo-alpha-sialidase [Bryobacteraceae bacterium]